jgi:hypothetical protein
VEIVPPMLRDESRKYKYAGCLQILFWNPPECGVYGSMEDRIPKSRSGRLVFSLLLDVTDSVM